jgi:predicted nucleic acid-binding protein
MTTFIDTNVLLCTIDNSNPAKQTQAIEAVAQASMLGGVAISTQVLIEFFNISTAKLKPGLSHQAAGDMLERLCEFEVVSSTAQGVLEACRLVQRYKLQWWDALILEAALRANADTLLSEDGQHGQRFGKLVVHNPFLGAIQSPSKSQTSTVTRKRK